MTDHSHSDVITILNTLIATTIDSITGYEDSAANIESDRLRDIFRQRADERQQVVEELRQEVEDLKAAVTGRDEKAIINEVERGEDYLKSKFETALDSDDLTGESRAVVERAYQSVRAGHDQISQLKHGLEASA